MASKAAAKCTIAAENEDLKPWGNSRGYATAQGATPMAWHVADRGAGRGPGGRGTGVVVLALLLCPGCRNEAARDDRPIADLSPAERAWWQAGAEAPADGGRLVRVRSPRYRFLAGSWVDTQGWEWLWVPAGQALPDSASTDAPASSGGQEAAP